MQGEDSRRTAKGRAGVAGLVRENAMSLEQRQQLQRVCDHASRLIAENERQLKRTRRMLLILEADRVRASTARPRQG